MIWENLTSPAIDALDRSIPVVLPVSAIEQHGPHLPVATDRIINEHFQSAIDSAISDEVLFLPTIAVTCSRHHMDFAGTLTLQHQTLLDQVEQTLSSAVEHGFRSLVMFNSHGGNQSILGVAMERFGAAHSECQVVNATWWRLASDSLLPLSETGPGGIGHACEFETSLVMLARPELVDEAAIPQTRANVATYGWAEGDLIRGAKAGVYRSMQAMTPNGAFGDPAAGTLEKGRAITEKVVDAMVSLLRDVRKVGV